MRRLIELRSEYSPEQECQRVRLRVPRGLRIATCRSQVVPGRTCTSRLASVTGSLQHPVHDLAVSERESRHARPQGEQKRAPFPRTRQSAPGLCSSAKDSRIPSHANRLQSCVRRRPHRLLQDWLQAGRGSKTSWRDCHPHRLEHHPDACRIEKNTKQLPWNRQCEPVCYFPDTRNAQQKTRVQRENLEIAN
jgi:hypothetical protein